MMPDDLFNSLDNLRIPESMLLRYQRSTKRDGTPRSKLLPDKFRFFQFPVKVFYSVLKLADQSNCLAAVIILAVLYEEWFKSFYRNPIQLSSRSLKAHRISKYRKFRALKVLEETEYFTVERERGKNPWITLRWLPRNHRLQHG
jgi:hypothetical protein